MNRAVNIDLKKDMQKLIQILEERGDGNHLEEIMQSTANTADYIRQKDRRFDNIKMDLIRPKRKKKSIKRKRILSEEPTQALQ